MNTTARTVMLMQRRRMETSCMLLLLVLLTLQLRDSSALQDANEILTMPVDDTQQQRHMNDLGSVEEFAEEELEQLRVGIPYHISVSPNIITGMGGRTFHGTGARGTGTSTGALLENGILYTDTHYFELTAPPSGSRVQTILFKNWAGVTVGVWSGSFHPSILAASHGPGSFVSVSSDN